MITLIVTALACFIGAAFAGAVGVGGAMISLPIMIFVMPSSTAVLICCAVGLWNVLLQSYAYRKDSSFSDIKWLALGTIPGVFIGVCILKYAPIKILQLIVCIFILIFIIIKLLIKNKNFKSCDSISFDVTAGLVCGIVAASVGMEGAILSIYVMLKNWSSNRMRGNMSLYLIVAVAWAIISQLLAGLYTIEIIPLICTGIAGSTAGVILGVKVGKRLNSAGLSKILLCFLCAIVIVLLYKAIT